VVAINFKRKSREKILGAGNRNKKVSDKAFKNSLVKILQEQNSWTNLSFAIGSKILEPLTSSNPFVLVGI